MRDDFDVDEAAAEALQATSLGATPDAVDVPLGSPEGFPLQYRIKSASAAKKGKDEWHTVTLISKMVASCDCPGYGYRRSCSHTREAMDRYDAGDLGEPPAAPEPSTALTNDEIMKLLYPDGETS